MKQQVLIVEDEFIVANHLRTILTKADYEVCGIAASVEEARVIVEKKKPTWVLLDIFLQQGSMGTDLGEYLNDKGIAFIYISANTNFEILEKAKATQPYGFLVKPFQERDLLTMMEIARDKHLNQIQLNQQLQPILQTQLELITESSLNTEEKLKRIPGIFQPLIPFEVLTISSGTGQTGGLTEITFIRSGFDEYQLFKNQEFKEHMGLSAKESRTIQRNNSGVAEKKIYNGAEFHALGTSVPYEKLVSVNFQIESKLSYPVQMQNGDYSAISFYNRKRDLYKPVHLQFLAKAKQQVGNFLHNLNQVSKGSGFEQINEGYKKSARIDSDKNLNAGFSGVIGKSPAILSVLDNVSLVAPGQTSVLILGESGTGKERIAHSIHQLSPRSSKPIITVNCGAMQKDLIESELFGHEKGAFTGAIENRIGKFELAEGGTIFLDEVGELPMEAQVKLLRVLQEREIEHVGGSRSIKVNVRIIAATNRNLEKEVAAGRFRLDLYYRLNVFPIEIPSLRDRKDDIPLLADYFIGKFSRQMEKEKPVLGRAVLKQLESYDWPGNIRELEHLLERSLLLNKGSVLNEIHLPANTKDLLKSTGSEPGNKTLEQIEAEYIISVLKRCNGKIGGPGGAAEILGLPPSTLNSKIKKLQIHRESYFNQ